MSDLISREASICDWDEGFTRKEMYEETNFCVKCFNKKCPYHIKAKTNK